MRIDRRLLGWGAFLIIVGAIPLLVRAGYLAEEAIRPWPTLWPLLLIGWGLGLLLRRTPGEVLGRGLNVLALGVMGGGLLATGFHGVPSFGACGDEAGGTGFANSSGNLGDTARVNVEFNCGTLAVGTIEGSSWTVAGTGPDGRGPALDADASGLSITPPDDDFMGFGGAGSAWDVKLPRGPLLDVVITLNAGDGTVDLTNAQLGTVNVTLNAGSMALNLADAAALTSVGGTVNAGSATFDLPAGVGDINLSLNAGSTNVCLPARTDLIVTWSGALGSNNFEDIGLIKVDDEHWTSGDALSGPRVKLDVSANAGSFDLTLGGACGA